jgi:hypothetical protein
MTTVQSIVSISEVVEYANVCGSDFFKSSMLKSIGCEIIKGSEAFLANNKYYFVTCDKIIGDKKPGYTVRCLNSLGNTKTLGSYQQFKSYNHAMRVIKAHLSK